MTVPETMTFDEVAEYFKSFADMRDDSLSHSWGTGMLELIGLLRNDPNFQNLYLTVTMYWMAIGLPEFFPPYIKIGCPAPESYKIFLEEDYEHTHELEDFRLDEGVAKVKEYVGYLYERKLEYLSKKKRKRAKKTDFPTVEKKDIDEITWDEMVDYYKGYIESKDTSYRALGSGMVDLIDLIRHEPEIQNLTLDRLMYWITIALPDYGLQRIDIMWSAPDVYKIYLTVDDDQEREIEVFKLDEAVAKIKEYIVYLYERKLEYPSKKKQKRK